MKLKKVIFILLPAIIIIEGCLKSSSNSCGYTNINIAAPAAEVTTLKDTLFSLGITNVTQDPAGFFYVINQQGSGTTISTLCTQISVSYKGTFLNGVLFDSTATGQVANIQLGQVIVGWQKSVPLVSKGGNITVFIPPSLGYGPNPVTDNLGNIIIPPNSYLKFNIQLVNIQ
jgi:FKBP-type peptidyl-prolyl cis-trans isomerase FkpA